MAFDKPTRNRLAKFVSDARGVIADEFTEQFQSLYGISAKGEIAPLDKLGHLDDAGLATAALLRERIDYLIKTHPDDKDGTRAAVARLAREQAFTILNRLAAIRMAEKRGLIVESVGQGYQSKGFKVFETVAGSALGDTYHRYRRYLFCLFDELAIDLGILFDRRSPQALLFPREPALLALLDLLHAADLEALWAEDETIGWIYQYYNDPEERKKMRKHRAPRNSRELAVRNQFFTPRYVVEFLTDNTLGRIWYEMSGGATSLKDQCRYLVRRPSEIFLAEGEELPAPPEEEGLSQEELLKLPVHIPHRPLKDPREIRLLDPACGSMHFGLYAFDLFETIYEEAWDSGSCPALEDAYASKDEFLKDVPRLIIEHNIHGIDIDPRAVQIAGLSLWLRAQKAWQARGVKPADRPRVRRSNIVCAEPMPGSPEMLEEFVATLKPDLLGGLVKTVFDKMQLAGEAGSLLKIEEEIRTAIDTARKEWFKQQDDLLTRKDGSQKEFFDTAEQQVIDALRAYAEQADADSYQRRLFADDAARGFAFIDLCRKRYDAVVMNPPFGEGTPDCDALLHRRFPSSKGEIYAGFVLQGKDHLHPLGRLGAITSRACFFLISLKDWRGDLFRDQNSITTFADLGDGVLDSAMVETAAYCVGRAASDIPCIRLNREAEKSSILFRSLAEMAKGVRPTNAYMWSKEKSAAIPALRFAYWTPPEILRAFSSNPRLEGGEREARVGFCTGDDFRYGRLIWEVATTEFGRHKRWVPFNKGGEAGSFYFDYHLVVDWDEHRQTLRGFLGRPGRMISRPNGLEHFFRPGIAWPLRTQAGFATRVCPEGFIFSHKGPMIFHPDTEALLALLALSNTTSFKVLVALQIAFGAYEVGAIQNTPVPDLTDEILHGLADTGRQGYKLKGGCYAEWEPSPHFFCFGKSPFTFDSLVQLSETTKHNETGAQGKIQSLLTEAEMLSQRAYGFSSDVLTVAAEESESVSAGSDQWAARTTADIARGLVSYCFGACFGRWDIRYATGERQPPELPDPFDPLPVCPPGMLQNAEGLPAEPKDVPADYPLRISWPGILVDDENHPEDIVARVEDALKVIWKDRWEAIEQEACEILRGNSRQSMTLRDYFRRPAAFFADHLKRYSKSRRQAPIYWPLSTKSGSYTLWLYYHRLTDQTLHTCLADFLDPKLRKVQSELDALTGSGGGGTRAGELREFLDELHDLRDEIERVIKLPWKPNLNDGVLITASPLYKLFRLPKWQKDLKKCWDKLEKGDYDWAHLAYTIWPARVEKACETDRSIAIAHDREDLCKVEPPKPKKKRAAKRAAKKKTSRGS